MAPVAQAAAVTAAAVAVAAEGETALLVVPEATGGRRVKVAVVVEPAMTTARLVELEGMPPLPEVTTVAARYTPTREVTIPQVRAATAALQVLAGSAPAVVVAVDFMESQI
jgi:hypothetical protein